MHENRETSSLTGSKKASPAGKGDSRNAGMNDGEGSDRAIVPVKPANKATSKIEAAERVEGRARTKENISQPHIPPAQNGTGMSQGLAGVRQAAKKDSKLRFTTLLHHVTKDFLRAGFQHLRKAAATGVASE